jgi:DNA-binding NarL/FixJ family response regulator
VTLLDLTEAAEGAALPGDTNGPTLALLGDGSPSGLPAQLWGAGVSYVSDAVSRGGLVAALEATAAGLQVRDPPPVRRPAPLRADPAPADGATLTEREREILRLLGEGLGNRDMAEALGVSDHTVKFHLHSIFQKLGVRSRTEAVSVAVRRGLLML